MIREAELAVTNMTNSQTTAFYHAFGMAIASEVPLDELQVSEPVSHADITIKRGSITRAAGIADSVPFMDFSDPQAVLMFWPTVGCFKIIGHETIIVDPDPRVEERFLAFPLLGPVMAWVLSRKKLFLLHASAIDINGRTAVFMGDKLAGKSTTAAAFLRAGHTLVTDDLVAINFEDYGRPVILPAFPQLKLAADAAAAVPISGAVAQPLIHADFPKRQHRLPSMVTSAVPVDWFFELKRGGGGVALTSFELAQAISKLNRFSYMSRFTGVGWSPAEEATHFRFCARLAGLGHVGQLQVPAGLERLPETVAFVKRLLHGGTA